MRIFSDAILDAMLDQDPKSRVACETLTTTGLVMVAGEVTTDARVDIAPIVRQVVHNVTRVTALDLDHAAIRALKSRALHYRLDLRRPLAPRPRGVSERGGRQPLPVLVEEYLRGRELPPGVPRERFVGLGSEYVAHAEPRRSECASTGSAW